MTIQKYLIINSRGNVRLAEREPRMAGNEIAVRISLDIPTKIFERPIVQATMKIPDEAVPKTKITPEITDNIQKIIKDATTLNMVVRVVEQPEEEKRGK